MSLTYIASEQVIPGYGGGMSSAKAVSTKTNTVFIDYNTSKAGAIKPFVLLSTIVVHDTGYVFLTINMHMHCM